MTDALPARAAAWWRARSTRVRLRFLVAGAGVLGLVLRDLVLVFSAALALLFAETMTQRPAREAARPGLP